jgi:hypothetical protein
MLSKCECQGEETMKKSIFFAIFLFLFIFSQSFLLAEETKRGASLGLTAGAYSFMWNLNSYRFGGEIGYQITSRIGIMAEFAYAGAKSSYKYSGNSATSSRKYTYTSVPINFHCSLSHLSVKISMRISD